MLRVSGALFVRFQFLCYIHGILINGGRVKHHILYTEDHILNRVRELAEQVNDDYAGEKIVLVAVLKGGFIFSADFMREIVCLRLEELMAAPVMIEFMSVSSYGDGTRPGDIKIELDLRRSIKGEHVILVEDVADTLNTLGSIQKHLRSKSPKSLRTVVFLSKPHNHQREGVELDYVGIVAEPTVGFVYGYGMDAAGAGRGLPFIAVKEG
jgi:hypoxanthine phosphoribosyltransferase